jgi:hypothetical protein
MNDDNIAKLVYEIDDMFAKYIEAHQISPLVLSSILLARMMRMNDACESGKEFRQILSEAPDRKPVEKESLSLH